jgi:hypothetical protein
MCATKYITPSSGISNDKMNKGAISFPASSMSKFKFVGSKRLPPRPVAKLNKLFCVSNGFISSTTKLFISVFTIKPKGTK